MSTLGAVVLSFNKACVFKRFWESLENQTRRPDQIVVIDDGSKDGSWELVRDLCKEWPAIQTQRIGQSAARNRGLELLNTDLAIFLDGDLLLQMNMLGRMEVELQEHQETSFVYCHYDRSGAVAGKMMAKPWCLNTLKMGNYVSPMSLVWRKDLPRPCFDEFLSRYEDWDLWLRMGQRGYQGRLIDEVLFTAYYQHGDLSSAGESQDHFWAVKQKHGL